MSLGRVLVPLTRLGDYPSWLWSDPEFCAAHPGPECYFERITTCDDYVRAHWHPTMETLVPGGGCVQRSGGAWVGARVCVCGMLYSY